MKVKLLRRVFCVVMCIVILACSSVNAFGAELFGEGTEYYWQFYSPSAMVSMSWIDVNIPDSSSSGINRGNLIAGINVWVDGTRNCIPYIATSELNAINIPWPSDGWIAHSIPGSSFWDGMFESYVQAVGTAAQTVLYSGPEEILKGFPNMENITRGYIYYNYNHNYMTGINWTNTVAHEMGHTLGFGHHAGVSTIMLEGNTNITALQQYDKDEFLRKYNSLP